MRKICSLSRVFGWFNLLNFRKEGKLCSSRSLGLKTYPRARTCHFLAILRWMRTRECTVLFLKMSLPINVNLCFDHWKETTMWLRKILISSWGITNPNYILGVGRITSSPRPRLWNLFPTVSFQMRICLKLLSLVKMRTRLYVLCFLWGSNSTKLTLRWLRKAKIHRFLRNIMRYSLILGKNSKSWRVSRSYSRRYKEKLANTLNL